MGRLTLTQFAERVGVSVSTISRAVSSGRVTAGPDGLLDEAGALAQFDQNRLRRRRRVRRVEPGLLDHAGPSALTSSGAFFDAKTRRETAEATMAEIRLAELAGKLVLRAEVDRLLFTAGRVLRDQLLSAPARLGSVLAPVSDPKVIEARIAEELRIGLRAFARQLRAGGVVAGGDGAE